MSPGDMRIGSAPQPTFSVPSSNQLTHPQLQSHAMLPPPIEQIKLRKYSREDWNAHRAEITRLYENGTLDSVMKSMRERYGLDATAKQYKDRVKAWGLNRNIRADEMESMINIQHRRNKPTAFRVRKRPVNPQKIKRYMRDHPEAAFGANKDGNMDGSMASAATPAAISYYTPSDTGPLTPHDVLSPPAAGSPRSSFAYQNLQRGSYQPECLDLVSSHELLDFPQAFLNPGQIYHSISSKRQSIGLPPSPESKKRKSGAGTPTLARDLFPKPTHPNNNSPSLTTMSSSPASTSQKKRGRASKAGQERRQKEAIDRGEILPPGCSVASLVGMQRPDDIRRHPPPITILLAGGAEDEDSSGSEQTQRNIKPKQRSFPAEPEEQTAVHDSIASADLQNPSDALRILAQVAARAENDDSPENKQPRNINNQPEQLESISWSQDSSDSELDNYICYKPLQDGLISPEMVYHLFSSYEEFFHPFFPIIPQETFNRSRLPWLSRAEPHLFSAILTVASKDNERVYQICYDHMQQLLSTILAGSDANVEAVEAFLILSQWVSKKSQASVGRGEEDKLAWMYIGNALRLGYLLEIDRTSFKSESHDDPAIFNRKRLVWSACYMCDIQISVRLGKGFWSRGPGPLSGIKSSDYPTLQPLSPDADNWALIFQANLELTQIFSNVHDVLYSSKGHNWKEMLEGRYDKYLDDFCASTRSWNDIWGTLICSSRLKASLLLTYDYLRLYINSFAYQAAISRALTFKRDSQHNPNRSIPLINATAPDARFVYEAVDAAKSLLSTFNNFIDPQTLLYMPSSYYLFIVYSAVFLYKATLTTTMTVEEREFIHNMIRQTVERLEKSSVGANHMGSRYARLLQLLWRKAPKRSELREPQHPQSLDNRGTIPQHHGQSGPQSNDSNLNLPDSSGMSGMDTINLTRPRTFSWLDLDAAWGFATQNNSLPEGTGEFDDIIVDLGLDAFDMSLVADFSLLEGDNSKLIF